MRINAVRSGRELQEHTSVHRSSQWSVQGSTTLLSAARDPERFFCLRTTISINLWIKAFTDHKYFLLLLHQLIYRQSQRAYNRNLQIAFPMASIWVSQLGTICNSKTLLLLFSILLLHWPLCGQSSPISNTHQRYRPAPGLGDGHGGVVDPSLLEQDNNNMNMQSLLESLKEQFLRTFNLSGLGPHLAPGSAREEPPEYMMELYNRFANDHTAMPTANIIRSFKNEGKDPLPQVMMLLLIT